MGSKGIVASSAALGVLLQEGIGDTIRVSLTPEPGGDRTLEVQVAPGDPADHGLPHLRAAGRGMPRLRPHHLDRVPGTGAVDIQAFIRDEMPAWKTQYPASKQLNVAVMGCIVNGPGESKHADIGISLPGTGETPAAPVFVDGKKFRTLRGPTIAAEFKEMVIQYIDHRFGAGQRGRRRLIWSQPRIRPPATAFARAPLHGLRGKSPVSGLQSVTLRDAVPLVFDFDNRFPLPFGLFRLTGDLRTMKQFTTGRFALAADLVRGRLQELRRQRARYSRSAPRLRHLDAGCASRERHHGQSPGRLDV